LSGVKTHTESIIINHKLFEFTWSINTFYNLLNTPDSLGVEINITDVKIDGVPMTSSYKRKFTSDTAIGKMENVILSIVKSKLNSRIHKVSNEISISYLEFNFKE
jgi:hypothetical protein